MTPVWKEAVKAKLKELNQTRSWLAQQLGVDKGAITRMLGDKQNTSALVPAICELLDIPPPFVDVDGGDDLQTYDDLRQLEPEDKEQVRALIATLRKLRDAAKKP